MYEEFSRHLSWTLDKLGYNHQIRHYRRESYKEMDRKVNDALINVEYKRVGSKGEGLTSMFESDTDVLYIDPFCVCLEDNSLDTAAYLYMNVLLMDFNAAPGHTLLQLKHLRNSGTDGNVLNSLELVGSTVYLSSTKFLEAASAVVKMINLEEHPGTIHNIAGPSVPVTFQSLDIDYVFVLRCECPTILRTWAMRQRRFDWPSAEIREKVVSMGGVVAATRNPGSENRHLEWRLCFNAGETELVTALNDCQCKLYVLLKKIVKEIIQPYQKEITSYIMKNVVFWLAEMNPTAEFTDSTLFQWTMKALRFLKRSIQMKYLPYYMIPQRNLLTDKMTPLLKARVVFKINGILRAGPQALLVIQTLNNAMVAVSPEQLELFHSVRHEFEEISLLLGIHMASALRKENGSMAEFHFRWLKDEDARNIIRRKIQLVFTHSDWRKFHRSGYDVDKIFDDMNRLLLM